MLYLTNAQKCAIIPDMNNPRTIRINGRNYTKRELGELLDVTTERIRQLDKIGLLEERVMGMKGLKPWEHKKRKNL